MCVVPNVAVVFVAVAFVVVVVACFFLNIFSPQSCCKCVQEASTLIK